MNEILPTTERCNDIIQSHIQSGRDWSPIEDGRLWIHSFQIELSSSHPHWPWSYQYFLGGKTWTTWWTFINYGSPEVGDELMDPWFFCVSRKCLSVARNKSEENNLQDNGLCAEETLAEIRFELLQYGCHLAKRTWWDWCHATYWHCIKSYNSWSRRGERKHQLCLLWSCDAKNLGYLASI